MSRACSTLPVPASRRGDALGQVTQADGCAGRAVHGLGLPGADAGRVRDSRPAWLRRPRGHGHRRPGQPGRWQCCGSCPTTTASRWWPCTRRPADHPAGLGPRPVGQAEPRRSWRRQLGAEAWSWCTRRSAGSASTPGTSRTASPSCRRGDRRRVRGREPLPAACAARRAEVDRLRAALEPGRDRLPARHPGPLARRRVRVGRAGDGRRARQQAGARAHGRRHRHPACRTSTWSPAAAPSRARSCWPAWGPAVTRARSCSRSIPAARQPTAERPAEA